MRQIDFNALLDAIREGGVKVPAVELEDKSDHSNVFEGSYSGEKTIEYKGYSFTYHVTAYQSCSIWRGGWDEPDDYDCSDPDIATEITEAYDPDGDVMHLTGSQKERLETLLNEKTEV